MRKVVLAMLVVGICSSANAAVLCAPKSEQGSVSVRTECKKNEVQLDPVALGLRGPTGPGAVVRDANGAFVGVMWTESKILQQGIDVGVLIDTNRGA